MKLRIFTTGGTIDKIYFDKKSQYEVGDPQAGSVLERANVAFEFELQSVLRQDSLDMTDKDRKMICSAVQSCPERHIVITHGTDTMIDTALALGVISGKTIVLTGSMYPARFHESDAVFNLGCAVIGAQTLGPGVYIAMNGRIFDPKRSRKNVEMNRFEDLDEGTGSAR
jgi:L-asparaginase